MTVGKAPYDDDERAELETSDPELWRELKAWAGSLYNESHWSRIIKNVDFYLKPGITWPRRTNGLSFRILPRGCVFSDKGPAIFVEYDE